MSNRFAVIDIGTNSVKLLIAQMDNLQRFQTIYEDIKITRLGENLHKRRYITDKAGIRTIAVIKEFADVSKRHNVNNISAVGTNAFRIAKNSDDFIKRCLLSTGIYVKRISPKREAYLSYLAVTHNIRKNNIAVLDIGGGSSEITIKAGFQPPEHKTVLIGAVNITERFLKNVSPTEKEIAFAENYILKKLSDIKSSNKYSDFTVIGVGGTIVTLGLIVARSTELVKANGVRLRLADIEEIFDKLSKLSLRKRRFITGLEKGREDIILGGTLILRILLMKLKQDSITISTNGIRHGLILERVARL